MPLFVILVSLTGLVLPDGVVQIRQFMQDFMGEASWVLHPEMDALKVSIINLVVFGIMLYSSSNVFNHMQKALNHIWDQESRFSMLLWPRIKAILLVLALALLLLVFIVTSSVLQQLGSLLHQWVPIPEVLMQAIHSLFALLLTTSVVAFLYFRVPGGTPSRSSTWLGALVTALLLLLGNSLISFYFAQARMPGMYGPFEQTLVLLLWAYYTVHVFLFGAIITRVWSEVRGALKQD